MGVLKECRRGTAPDEMFSAELLDRLGQLTPKQRAAIPRIVRVRSEGGSIESLLRGEERICTRSTFYGRGQDRPGWYQQPAFRETLAMAQREYDTAVLRGSVQEAAEILRRTAPLAAGLVQQMILEAKRALAAGDDTSPALRTLKRLLTDEDPGIRLRAARMLQQVVDSGIRAGLGVLDRADIETAVKGLGGADERFAALLAELRDVGENGHGHDRD